MFGHPGMGGQNVKVDIKNKVAFAYICNGLKCGAEDYTMTFMRLQKALYQCLDNNNLLNDDVSINEIPIEGKNNSKFFLLLVLLFVLLHSSPNTYHLWFIS